MPVPTRIRNEFPTIANAIVNYQIAYFEENGRYWQGIRTHEIAPTDGRTEVPIKTRRPSDQAEDWSAISLPNSMDVALEVHTYDGPNGKGYIIFGECIIDGEVWRRAINFGPETYRDSDWIVINVNT